MKVCDTSSLYDLFTCHQHVYFRVYQTLHSEPKQCISHKPCCNKPPDTGMLVICQRCSTPSMQRGIDLMLECKCHCEQFVNAAMQLDCQYHPP